MVEELLAAAHERLHGLAVERVVIGLAYTAVLLSDGSLGLAATPHEGGCHTHPAAGELSGRAASDLAAGLLSPDPLSSTLGLATVNAVLGDCAQKSPDPIEVLGIEPESVVGVVGYIDPLIRDLRTRAREVIVFERNLARPGVLPDWAVETELPRCDVVFITGTAFANKTIGRLVELSQGRVAVIGPSTPLWAGLLTRGIDALFGARARNPEGVLRTVAEGGGTRALFRHGLEKVALWREKPM
ncbi:MAG: Rossmann-like domain-containing protein [Candidatus Bipolaricaulaceae bacterium]